MSDSFTPELADQIVAAGVKANMFHGDLPTTDGGKLEAAQQVVEIARQSNSIAETIGPENVPNYENIKAILDLIGVAPVEGTTELPAPPPSATAPASPTGAEDGSEAQAASPALPAASDPHTAPTPAPDERWLDAEGNEWAIIKREEGGQEVEVASVSSGEMTVVPIAFLVQRSNSTQTPPSPPSTPPSDPSPAPSAPPESSPSPATAPSAPAAEAAPSSALSGAGSPAPSAPSAPASPPSSPSSSAEAYEPSGMDVFARPELIPGQKRYCAGNDTIYRLGEAHQDATQVFVLDPNDGLGTIARDIWEGWPEVPDAIAPDPESAPSSPAPVAEAPAPPPAQEPEPEAEAPRHSSQEFVIPDDDDEGDEEYGDLLSRVTAMHQPTGMPLPMELDHEPTPLPDDLTSVSDSEARRLHSERNALASRARYLHGLELAKSRACGVVRDGHQRAVVRELRKDYPKATTITELRDIARDTSEAVQLWADRATFHEERAAVYKIFLTNYTEDVSVLSRDWTMRDREEKGS